MAQDADRWQRWFAVHGAALVLFARRWSATHADAEDAVQDGFARFWKTRAQAHDELAYLYACVRSAAIDRGRNQLRRQTRETSSSLSDESPFESSAAEHADRHAVIQAALDQLPVDQRDVVIMKVWGGMTFGQIGQVLDVSINTAASRYRYALEKLESLLSQEVIHD